MGEEDYKELVTIAAKHLTLEDCPAQEIVQLQVQPISKFVLSRNIIQKIDNKKMDHNTFALLDDQMDGYMSKLYRISKNHMLILSIGKNTIKIM
jgi:hypothetical protein